MMKYSAILPIMCAASFIGASSFGGSETIFAPYGAWRSPITPQMLVQGAVRFGDVTVDGSTLYWVEGRPEEQGRYVIVRRTPDGKIVDVLPAPFSARTTVHEYGGGAILAVRDVVYFTNYADQRIWQIKNGRSPQPVTADSKLRFADFIHNATHNRLVAVCEDHSAGGHEPVNRIVAIDLAGGKISTLVEGADFYSNPRLSPDGRYLAWLSWNHPNMPWDETELSVAIINNEGSLSNLRKVAGGLDESIFQPSWSPDGTLYFVSDRTDWWNLYAERNGKIEAILSMEAEFGTPQWVFGMTTYGFQPDGSIIARYTRRGKWFLAQIDPRNGKYDLCDLPYSNISSINLVGAASEDRAKEAPDSSRRLLAYIVAGSPTVPESLIEIDLTSGQSQVIRKSTALEPIAGYTSVPEAIEFATDDDNVAHAFYYPPTNCDFRGPIDEAGPLLVLIHGGPTSATTAQFRVVTQFWTSRGFGICDVNYGGSTGYGRKYRNRLRDSWGVVDVQDAANAARFLAEQGKADPKKLIIRGGSAGGYTTLACLAFGEVFCCGASYYGISDLALMVHDTHKFESRYLDRLVGLYPQDEARYRQRSPIYHLEHFKRPVILLQGLEDKVVPPNQAEVILDSLKRRGVPVAYVSFAGEQHGFRKAENIIRAHEAELYFYSRILGFELADKVEPIEIYNLP